MIVVRLASSKWAVNSGEGASKYGGRWNLQGTPVIYAASSRSLATLEILAHHKAVPGDYQVIVIDIPADVAIEKLEADSLSTGDEPARLGTEWAASLRTAVLRVPSAIWPAEYNYVLNPLHPEFQRIRFSVSEERIDGRLKEKSSEKSG